MDAAAGLLREADPDDRRRAAHARDAEVASKNVLHLTDRPDRLR